jgi:hypothetical protein
MRFTFRLIILAGIVCGSAFGFAQDLSRKISYSTPAAPIAKVLGDLTSAGGVLLRTGTQTKGDILCVRFEDVTVREAMDKIAEALDAEWKDSEGGFLLTRTATAELKAKREEVAARAKMLDTTIKKAVAEVEAKPTLTEADAQQMVEESRRTIENLMRGARTGGSTGVTQSVRGFRQMGQSQPGGRAIVRLLGEIPAQTLAELRPGTRTVFSTRPTSMQEPMPGGASRIIDKFLEEQRTLEKSGGTGPLGIATGDIRLLAQGGGNREILQTGRPGKTLLVVTRNEMMEGLQCQLTVYDAQSGEAMTSGFYLLSPEPPAESAQQATNEQPIPISDLSKQFAKLVGSASGGLVGATASFIAIADGGSDVMEFMSPTVGAASKPVELTPDWRERILNPDKFEPLSTVPSDIYLGLAKMKQRNLVAAFPDGCLIPAARRISQGDIRPSEALAKGRETWKLDIAESDGWIVIRPAERFTAREQQVDRVALAKLLKSLNTNGRLTLDELATYSLTAEAINPINGIDFFSMRIVDPATADRQFNSVFQGNRQMLQFYGLLGASQKTSLGAGRPLPLSGLSQRQRDLVHAMVYHSLDGPRVDVATGPPGPRGQNAPQSRLGRNNLLSERTEALPSGIPTSGFLNLRVENDTAVLATDANGNGGQYLTAEALGRQRAMASNAQFAALFPDSARYERFRLARQTTYRFRFDFTRNISLNRNLVDAKVDPNSQAVAYEDLPRDFRREAEAQANRVRSFVPGQSADPPPPLP